MQLNQKSYKVGDKLTAQFTEELRWGYDLYLAVMLPSGDFLALNDKNTFNPLNKASPWRGKRQQGITQFFIGLTIPALPAGRYCLYAILSPEDENVLTTQTYWKFSEQCFVLVQ